MSSRRAGRDGESEELWSWRVCYGILEGALCRVRTGRSGREAGSCIRVFGVKRIFGKYQNALNTAYHLPMHLALQLRAVQDLDGGWTYLS